MTPENEIKPHHKVNALLTLSMTLLEMEDTAALTGEGDALLWAFKDVRTLIKERIESIAERKKRRTE